VVGHGGVHVAALPVPGARPLSYASWTPLVGCTHSLTQLCVQPEAPKAPWDLGLLKSIMLLSCSCLPAGWWFLNWMPCQFTSRTRVRPSPSSGKASHGGHVATWPMGGSHMCQAQSQLASQTRPDSIMLPLKPPPPCLFAVVCCVHCRGCCQGSEGVLRQMMTHHLAGSQYTGSVLQ